MLDTVLQFISDHQVHAPWIVFTALILAGINVPISIDIVLVFCAFLAASVMPHSMWPLYFSILIGCSISGWIAYSLGRFFGRRLLSTKLMSKMLPPSKIDKVETYYQKYGIATLIIGRFIPFGVRNCIFVSTGLSKMNFFKFALIDFIACSAWSSIMFFSFYHLGKNFEVLKQHLKVFNIVVFLAFSVTVITVIWYKYRKKRA
ncbi:MAG: DedA family protein [Simkaniaceae bacterium]|nr:DedA family protein [Simkaniaceae bacterium]MCF7852297.1 DedA family protein [Simkaniaceae bacterium]